MKIKFLGVGSAFTTPDYYQSNLLITARSGKQLLLDCGSDARFALAEYLMDERKVFDAVDAVYISHLHADHIGGMEWLAFSTYFSPQPSKLVLFMEGKLMQKMWDHCLKGGLECIEGKMMQLTDYFDCRPQAEDGTFNWEGIQCTLVKMPHIITDSRNFAPNNAPHFKKPSFFKKLGFSSLLKRKLFAATSPLNHYSYGLLLTETDGKGTSVFITTDTQFRPNIIADMAEKADIIFHDCETTPFNTPVHAHYDELCTLEAALKQKMWLYHYQPHPSYQTEADGFKGFVVKGQEFDLADSK
jgi:ribonuclease BN (tRNA processing enzyme)